MVISKDLIKENVEGLNDEQIESLSKLMDNAISGRVSEIYRDIDKDIETVTGKKKPANMKTYEFLKEELSSKGGDNSEALTAANDQIKSLENQLSEASKKGNNTAQIQKLEKDLKDANDLNSQLKETIETTRGDFAAKLKKSNVRTKQLELQSHLVGVKLRDDIPPELVKLAVNNAISSVAAYDSETDDNGLTIYRDANGSILTNKKNALNPYTGKELLLQELEPVLAKGKKQEGSGTRGQGKAAANGTIKVAATTQVEAMDEIVKSLYSRGIPQSDPRHQEEVDKAYKENKVAEMPAQ